MKLSEEEKQLILEKRRQKEAEKPIKVGYLKHDLYRIPSEKFNLLRFDWMITKDQKEKLINILNEDIVLELPKGSEFDCYLERGNECWYDQDSGSIAGADSEWAKEHLKDIKSLRK